MPVEHFVKRPIPVPMLKWTGDNYEEMVEFTDPPGSELQATRFRPIEHQTDPTITARVYDHLHDAWIPLRTGDYIAKGPEGECYPIKESVHAETYMPAAPGRFIKCAETRCNQGEHENYAEYRGWQKRQFTFRCPDHRTDGK